MIRARLLSLGIAGFGAAIALSACGGSEMPSKGAGPGTSSAGSGGSGGSAVTIQDFRFAPTPLEVPVGTEIVWTNADDAPHTVTGTAGADFDSGELTKDEKFSMTFATPGTYSYLCDIHQYMTGSVRVS